MASPASEAAEEYLAAPAGSSSLDRRTRGALWICLGAQIVLLFVVGWQNREVIESDGLAYVQLASYYVQGKWNLMVSGYWGPMLSWLIAPLLMSGVAPLIAVRIVCGLSAVLFLISCISVFRRFQLSESRLLLASVLVAVATLFWSVSVVSPDLLTGGLVCLAISKMNAPAWLKSKGMAFRAGLLWGAAYLAKAIAFPLALMVCIAFATMHALCDQANLRRLCQQLVVTFLGFSLLAGPWITFPWQSKRDP